MIFYAMPGTCALSVHIALEWIGQPYELKLLAKGENREPAYLKVHPLGKVPAVRTDEGQVLTEAAAILGWLVDTHPDASIGPAQGTFERARLTELLAYLTSEVHVAFGPYFAPDRYLAEPAQHEALRATALTSVARHMAMLDQRLVGNTHLLGQRSAADAYLYVLLRWSEALPGGVAQFANLSKFRRRLEQDSGVRAALKAEHLSPIDS